MSAENSGYATFALYHTLKLHFTSKSYDYIKYHGKCNISKDDFLNRRDKYIFYAISRKYDLHEAKNFFIANLFLNPKTWVGELNSSEADEVYTKWQKRNQALTYNFEQDIISLLDKVEEPWDMYRVFDGQEPLLLKELYYGNITPETLIIINRLGDGKIFDMWLEKIHDDIVFPGVLFKLKKYEPFIDFDVVKFKKILTGHLVAHK